MYCDNCGSRIDDDSKFCENCGVLVDKEAEPESEAQSITDLDELMEMELKTGEEVEKEEVGAEQQEEPANEMREETELESNPKSDFTEEPQEWDSVPEEEPEPAVVDPQEVEPEQVTQETIVISRPNSLFCMACGKKLPDGAAFCDGCGTPTGEVAPAEIHRRRTQKSMFLELLKKFFLKPASTIEKAASEDAFLSGVGFLIIKDVVIAILSAIFMSRISATLGFFGGWLTGGDAFGFGAKIVLIALVLDALWIGALYGMSILFKGNGFIKELVGAWGTASLFSAAILIVMTILAAFAPTTAICAGLAMIVVLVVTTMKAVAASMKLTDDLLIYMVSAAAVSYIVVIFAVISIFR